MSPKPKRAKGAQPANQNAAKTGFYSDHFTEEELARIAALTTDPTLDDEIWMQRVLNHRLLAYAARPADGTELAVQQLIQVVETLAIGTGRVARLLRDKRALSGEAADGLTGAIAQALDELGTELGLEL